MTAIPREPAARGAAAPGDAEQLLALVRECSASGIARRALLLRLSTLRARRARPHHLRLAREALIPLARADRARQFELPNEDTVIVWRGETTALPACRDTLRFLFADEPDLISDPDALAELHELPHDAETLITAVEESTRTPRIPANTIRPTTPLDPPTLAMLEKALAQTDVSRFVRRQPVCRLDGGAMHLCWEQLLLSDDELFETLLPDRAPRADPWLFRRLTRTLDRRLLSMLGATDELRRARPFSLDLNVASLLSPEFLHFDAALPAVLRGQVLVNIRPEDILADPTTFLFARDFAHARAYRLLLHDATASQLALLPPDRLGLDMAQLLWSEETAAIGALPDGISIILGRADTRAAIIWGQARGVAFYQGQRARPKNG